MWSWWRCKLEGPWDELNVENGAKRVILGFGVGKVLDESVDSVPGIGCEEEWGFCNWSIILFFALFLNWVERWRHWLRERGKGDDFEEGTGEIEQKKSARSSTVVGYLTVDESHVGYDYARNRMQDEKFPLWPKKNSQVCGCTTTTFYSLSSLTPKVAAQCLTPVLLLMHWGKKYVHDKVTSNLAISSSSVTAHVLLSVRNHCFHGVFYGKCKMAIAAV